MKQAPRAWYERLHNYLVKIGFERINDNYNLYLKNGNNEVLLSKIFVDGIIFGGKEALCKSFSNEMKKEFEMSMFGEIKIFVSKYIKEILKTSIMEDSRPIGITMATRHKISKSDDSTKVN